MHNPRLKILGINIKAERLKKGLSQEKLAELINISLPTVSLIETGKQNTSVLNLIDIASTLDVEITKLIQDV